MNYNENIKNIEDGFRYKTARYVLQALIQGKDAETIDSEAVAAKAVELTDCLLDELKSSTERKEEKKREERAILMMEEQKKFEIELAERAKASKARIESLQDTNPIIGSHDNMELIEVTEYTGTSKNIKAGEVYHGYTEAQYGEMVAHLFVRMGGSKGTQKIFATTNSKTCKWRKAGTNDLIELKPNPNFNSTKIVGRWTTDPKDFF